MPAKISKEPPAKLTPTEEDLLWRMGNGYQLETDSLWENPILRRMKDNTEMRAASVNRRTIDHYRIEYCGRWSSLHQGQKKWRRG
jgi:hypothetical protein